LKTIISLGIKIIRPTVAAVMDATKTDEAAQSLAIFARI